MDQSTLNKIVKKHGMWLRGEEGGERANLSAANLRDANLSAANLSAANLSAANLRDANLSAADLSAANLSDADLRAANLSAADLRAANLRDADLRAANLSAADLRAANLRDADLRDAKGLTEDSDLLRRVCQSALQENALEMGSWHTCETTHCIGGWAIHHSGRAGRLLETMVGSGTAASLLLPQASHMFHASNNDARDWLEETLELLEKEPAS